MGGGDEMIYISVGMRHPTTRRQCGERNIGVVVNRLRLYTQLGQNPTDLTNQSGIEDIVCCGTAISVFLIILTNWFGSMGIRGTIVVSSPGSKLVEAKDVKLQKVSIR